MPDPYIRIQEHLGSALRKLAVFEVRVNEGQDRAQDRVLCLAELQRVAQDLDQAFSAVKWERQRVTNLAADAEATMRRARKLFVESPTACLIVQRESAVIEEANAAASRLLNVSPRHLMGKPLTHFLQQDREIFLRQLQRPADTSTDQWHVTMRPRERAVVRVLVSAIVDTDVTAAIVLSPCVRDRATDDDRPGYPEPVRHSSSPEAS